MRQFKEETRKLSSAKSSLVTQKWVFAGILNFCGIEHYPASGPLRLMRNGEWLLVENTDDTPFRGTLPTAVHPARKLPEAELEIPALGSVLLKLPR